MPPPLSLSSSPTPSPFRRHKLTPNLKNCLTSLIQPIVPPEDLGAEQNYRWRPSRRDSSAAKDAAEGKSRRRRRNRKAEVSNVGVTESRKTGRGRGRQSEWEEELEEDRPLSRNYVVPSWKEDEAFRGKREENKRGGGGDARAVEQLRRKQRQLVDRELALEVDLDKVGSSVLG